MIIDSHIHLWPNDEKDSISWQSPSGPQYEQYCVEQYSEALSPHPDVRGFVVVEVDRKSSVDPATGEGWKNVLDETAFFTRIATGKPKPGQGHSPSDARLCLGFIPWAPVPSGPAALEKYVSSSRKITGDEAWNKVKGFRYLLQESPQGTGLTQEFIDGLRWLGEHGLVFDLGLDMQEGMWQLEEAIQMIKRAHADASSHQKVSIIVEHLCNPEMSGNPETATNEPVFIQWGKLMDEMASFPNVYMKLSGGMSGLPVQSADNPWPAAKIANHIRPWVTSILNSFGPSRIMFGSDWPVCNLRGAGNSVAWKNWTSAIAIVLDEAKLSEQEKRMI